MITIRRPAPKTKSAPAVVFEDEEIDADWRTTTREMLAKIVEDTGVYDEAQAVGRLARDLECCILVYSKNNPYAYRKKLNQLTFNLRHNGVFLLRSYYPWELGFINNEALGQNTAEEVEALRHKEQISAFQKVMNDTVGDLKAKADHDRVGASLVRCRACKSTNIFDFQKQTRAADEGMTWFYHCRDCGKTGKMS